MRDTYHIWRLDQENPPRCGSRFPDLLGWREQGLTLEDIEARAAERNGRVCTICKKSLAAWRRAA